MLAWPHALQCQLRSLSLPAGADVRAATKDGDTVFTYVIYLLGEMPYSRTDEEAEDIERFCFRVTQLLLAHGANPSECPASESLTHFCLKSFKDYFPLLRFLLESGAACVLPVYTLTICWVSSPWHPGQIPALVMTTCLPAFFLGF